MFFFFGGVKFFFDGGWYFVLESVEIFFWVGL